MPRQALCLVLIGLSLTLFSGCSRKKPTTAPAAPVEEMVATAPAPAPAPPSAPEPAPAPADPLEGDLASVNEHIRRQGLLGDVYYAEVVEALDAKAAQDPALTEQIKVGVAALDQALGVPWLELSPGTQVEVLESIADTPFFQAVRGHTVVALYNHKLLWPQFAYQGSSFEYGGYIRRGFQDAGWTLQPDEAASPLPYLD